MTVHGVAAKETAVELWPIVLVDVSQLMDARSGAVGQVAETAEAAGASRGDRRASNDGRWVIGERRGIGDMWYERMMGVLWSVWYVPLDLSRLTSPCIGSLGHGK